jgi:transcriptional regulator with XRE-family HTH domain
MAVKRREKGITQEELAAHIGVSQVEVSYYERGVSAPSEGTRKKISAKLEVEDEDLFLPFEDYVLKQHGVTKSE